MINKPLQESAKNNWLIQRSVHEFMYTLSRLEANNIDMLSVVHAMVGDKTQSIEQNRETLHALAFTIGSVLQDLDDEVEDHDK